MNKCQNNKEIDATEVSMAFPLRFWIMMSYRKAPNPQDKKKKRRGEKKKQRKCKKQNRERRSSYRHMVRNPMKMKMNISWKNEKIREKEKKKKRSER